MNVRWLGCLGIVAVAAVLASGGCGKRGPALIPVTGTVTLDGQPLEGVNVTFMPVAGAEGEGGIAVTDASGKYELKQFRGTGKGTAAGEYRVTISKVVMADGSPIPADKSAAEVQTKDLLPAKYSDLGATTLTATVKEGGQPINFDLKSK